MERSRRSDFAFLHPLRVRWSEVDRQSIVFTRDRKPIPLPEKWVNAILVHERIPPQRKA